MRVGGEEALELGCARARQAEDDDWIGNVFVEDFRMPLDIGIGGAMASRVCFPPTSAGAAGCRRNVPPES